ncbi:MAG: response regulator transcription factor [Rhodocyclaceae bacterium]|nr:response regulator transcription factor [Rhodocyclaceae bacterium]
METEAKTMADILVVEDEADIANLVRLHLEMLGHRVLCCDTLAYARRALDERAWALVVLDLCLPDGDGLDFCRALRDTDAALPVLMLTARSTEHDRVRGLETGADDYLAKPFGVLELQARIRALLRRAALLEPAPPADGPFEVPPLRVDPARRAASRDGVALDLTATEFDLLSFLARQPGVVFSRQQLLSEVWGYHHAGYEHTVNSHINRLRAKIEQDPSRPRLIRTVWGVGYKLEAAEAA